MGRPTAEGQLRWKLSIGVRGCLTIACLSPAAVADEPSAQVRLTEALRLLDLEGFSEALDLLRNMDPSQLSAEDRVRFEEHRAHAVRAAAGAADARRGFDAAITAVIHGRHGVARDLLHQVVDHPWCPAELRITARARLARIRLIETRQRHNPPTPPAPPPQAPAAPPAGVADPDPGTDLVRARRFVAQGMGAIDAGRFDEAQSYFNEAILLFPDAPREQIRVHAGPRDVSGYPLAGTIHEVRVLSPPRVMMNLNLGFGRLVAVNSFQFSGGPTSGVAAPGFVQRPILQRTQIKTSASAPGAIIGGRRYTFETDYLILTRPLLDP